MTKQFFCDRIRPHGGVYIKLDIDKICLIVDFVLALAIVILAQTDIVVPLALVSGIYLSGMMLDELTTYCCAKFFGIKNFFYQEQNEITKKCVKKFGLIPGLIMFEIHPEKLLNECLLIGSFGFVISSIVTDANFGTLKFLTPGLLFLGCNRIFAAINNANVIRTEYRPTPLPELSAREEF